MELALHKNMETIVGQYEGLIAADIVERQATENVSLFAGMDELMQQYESMFSIKGMYKLKHKIKHKIKDKVSIALTPEQIAIFLSATRQYETINYYSRNTGLFVTRLVQNSYKRGYNNFHIDLNGLLRIDYLGYNLQGREENPICLDIKGTAGDYLGKIASYAHIRVDRAGKNWAEDARHIMLTAAELDPEYHNGPIGSILKTNNRTLLPWLRVRGWNHTREPNRIYFIHPDGREELI
ncbi:MAG TPA: hypothetical protein HA362_03850 [Nanoarchaeota archaeon]|nr:hypothetical protein [Nanoarchaeota archaeon]